MFPLQKRLPSLLIHSPICQAAGFSRYGFRYLRLCYLDAVGLIICAGFMSYDVRPPFKICCLDQNNILCRLPINAFRPCIYLACHLRKRFIVLFRLATGWLIDWHYYEDCTLPELSLGVGSAKFEPNSYLDPW